jgi:hypothetical protein
MGEDITRMPSETIDTLTIPMFRCDLPKAETQLGSVDDVVARFRAEIDGHPCAQFIGVFDHYRHTRGLPDGEIAPEILAAKNVVFCFGMALPEAAALATRPRSIGIAELADRFVIVFLEPPMPIANATMERWIRALSSPP